jgi:hypothetical protein
MSQLRQQSEEACKEGHIEVQQKIQQSEMKHMVYMTKIDGEWVKFPQIMSTMPYMKRVSVSKSGEG